MASWDPYFSDSRRSPSPDSSDSNSGLTQQTTPPAPRPLLPRLPPDITTVSIPNPQFPHPVRNRRSSLDRKYLLPFRSSVPSWLPQPALCRYFVFDDVGKMTHVEHFEPNHRDRVTSLDVNFDASLILTASLDHRIKIFSRDPKTGEKTVVETFTAHDAYIRDAKWLHSTNGNVLVTAGDDRRLRVWKENLTQLPNSGHRYHKVAEIHSGTTLPFVSLDLKTVDSVYNYLVAVDRRGLLSVFEPTSADDLKEWTLIDQWTVCEPPSPGDETSFKVRFDPNVSSVAYINNMTDEKSSLGLAVTALDEVKIYRSVFSSDALGPTSGRSVRFYLIATLPQHPKLVRDVQWAPFNVRGCDLLASACRDGTVQIFEMHTMPKTERERASRTVESPATRPISQRPQPKSSLTTAIAGRAADTPSVAARVSESRTDHKFPYNHQIERVAQIEAHLDAWSLAWDPTGQVLMSVGSEGATKMWKKSVVQGEWKLFADQAFVREE